VREISKEYLIGTGGWAYFQVPGLNSLTAYSRAFNFVEVNSTFYQMPTPKEVEAWRRLVPPDFHFAVRANRVVTHKNKFQPTEEALETFERMKQICNILKADVLHLQVPSSFKMNETSIAAIRDFLHSVDLGNSRLALEIRSVSASELPAELAKTMQDNNIIHCVDLSKGEMPAYNSDILYSRLFGKGYHNVYQPTDEELGDVDAKASNSKSDKVMMSFHFVRMYKDAARLKIYKETGKFPMVTGSTGLSSLEEVLSEDASFPAAKQDLVHSQGWRLFDQTETERIRAAELLQKLPEGTYKSVDEVTDALKTSRGHV
jgi:uncharacterized protein YecE (DUF72 family)